MNAAPQYWRERAPTQRDNVAALLVERAKEGMCVRMNEPEILTNPQKYGKRPPNRIGELRADGWDIGGKALGESDWCYWLRRDGDGRTYPTRHFDEPPHSPRPQLVNQPEIKTPWNERQRVTGLPLWDSAVSQ